MTHAEKLKNILFYRPDLFSGVTDLARRLHVSRDTIYKWMDGARNPLNSNAHNVEALYEQVMKNVKTGEEQH